MARYRDSQQRGNTLQTVDLDSGFLGVDNRLDPSLLRTGHQFYDLNQELMAPGLVSDARNMRFRSGKVETRAGSMLFLPLADYVKWLLFDDTSLWLDVGLWADPSGDEWLLVVTEENVWALADGRTRRKIPVPAGEAPLAEPVRLVQAFDQMILLRGEDETPLVWDGDFSGEGFTTVSEPEAGAATDRLPNSQTGTVMGNRLWVKTAHDTVAASDVLDYNAFDLALNVFRMNEGSSDRIIALAPWRNRTLVVFKDQSISALREVSGDLSAVTAEVIHSNVGCAAERSVAAVGGDLIFLGHDGVYRVSQVVEDALTVAATPISEPVEGYIDRINWAHAHKAAAIVSGRYYYLSLPLDDDTEPRHVLVLDTVTGYWQGLDSYNFTGGSEPIAIRAWARTRALGKKRAIALNPDSRWILATEVGHHDIDARDSTFLPPLEIVSEVTTRGYPFAAMGEKRPKRVLFRIETWNPLYEMHLVTDGAYEEVPFFPFGELLLETGGTLLWDSEGKMLVSNGRRKDRTEYFIFAKGTYDTSNAGDDHQESGREDYSVWPEDGPQCGEQGLAVMQTQEFIEAMPLRGAGAWAAFRFVNRSGYFALKSVQAEALHRYNQLKSTA